MKRLQNAWHELKRRKVIPYFIAYVAACFAIIEFVDILSGRFTIPDKTIDLIYILSALGLPVVILLPWFFNRLKDITADEVPHQSTRPAKKEEIQATHNLPAQLTTFIGREKETAILKELIGIHRITTISGSGGCGKTRLACEVAGILLPEFKDGVWFVDLAPITSEDLVAKEITEALRIPEEPGTSFIETLISRISNKNILIILDNCEHLIHASAEASWKLIQAVPGLRIVATSREPLGITGEKVWRIPSLTLLNPNTIIDLESAKQSEAVQLFADRAQLNNPDFELLPENIQEVVTICNKLDGIPLALELVASRTRHLKPQVILERLGDKFDLLATTDQHTSQRQQTLYATIEWGYNLLSESEKLLFTRLSVFTGGFDIQSAEEVCSDEQIPKDEILELLSNLVDKSLVHFAKGADQTTKYNFYETLRQFALKSLQLSKREEQIRMKHLKYFLNLAKEGDEERWDSQNKWLIKLEIEHDNLMAALMWSEEHATEDFVLLTGYLAWFWTWHSHFFTGGNYLNKAVIKGGKQTEAYARVIGGAGMISIFTGEPEAGLKLNIESLETWRHLDNKKEIASKLTDMSNSNQALGNAETGLKYAEEGLSLAQQVDQAGLINYCRSAVCQGLVALKKIDSARAMAQLLLESSTELEQPAMMRLGYHFIADCDLMENKYIRAEKGYCSALEVAFKTANMFFVCIELLGLALALAGQSKLAKAIRISTVSREYALQNGILVPENLGYDFWQEFIKIYLVKTREELGEKLNLEYEEEGKKMGLEEAIEYALDIEKA